MEEEGGEGEEGRTIVCERVCVCKGIDFVGRGWEGEGGREEG